MKRHWWSPKFRSQAQSLNWRLSSMAPHECAWKDATLALRKWKKLPWQILRFLVINSIKVAAGENVNFTCVLCTRLRPERSPFPSLVVNDKIKESKIESVMMKSRWQGRSFERRANHRRTQNAWKLKYTKWCFGFFCASIATCCNYHADLLWRSTCLSHCSNSQFGACCDFKVAQTIWKVGFAWQFNFYFFLLGLVMIHI